MRETDLVTLIQRLNASGAPGLVKGIGDDCAVIRPKTGEDLLVTTDFLLEGVHFLRETHTAADCGWKCLARGLSDIAAMGGAPRYAFVSLALAPWTQARWVRDFYTGMRRLARRHGVVIAGGDLTKSDTVLCDIIVLGAVKRGRALCRSGANPGDRLYVTGLLGASALGLETHRGKAKGAARTKAWLRHLRPEPRIEAGLALVQLKATACMDLSDGLALDLHRLCQESGCSAELNGALPVFPGASIRQALSGGEDYELLFAAPARQRIPVSVAGLPITGIGCCVKGKTGRILFDGKALPAAGWDPFSSSQRSQ